MKRFVMSVLGLGSVIVLTAPPAHALNAVEQAQRNQKDQR